MVGDMNIETGQAVEPVGSEPSMTLNQLIEQLNVVRDAFGAGGHGIAVSVVSGDNFTSTDVQVCGASLKIEGVSKPCVALAVMRPHDQAGGFNMPNVPRPYGPIVSGEDTHKRDM